MPSTALLMAHWLGIPVNVLITHDKADQLAVAAMLQGHVQQQQQYQQQQYNNPGYVPPPPGYYYYPYRYWR